MAVKMEKKKNITFENGYFMNKKGKLVGIEKNVLMQLDQLETMYQQYLYVHEQPKAQAEPSLVGWERKHMGVKHYEAQAYTPLLDAKREEAMRLMDEIDSVSETKEINDMMERYSELLNWVDKKKVLINTEGRGLSRVDTPMLGNPLELTPQKIIDIFVEIASDGEGKHMGCEQIKPGEDIEDAVKRIMEEKGEKLDE